MPGSCLPRPMSRSTRLSNPAAIGPSGPSGSRPGKRLGERLRHEPVRSPPALVVAGDGDAGARRTLRILVAIRSRGTATGKSRFGYISHGLESLSSPFELPRFDTCGDFGELREAKGVPCP